MRNNSFYETFLNFSHFSSQIQKMCTFSILATVFAQITNLKMQIYMFQFSSSIWSESFNCFKQILGHVILEKMF